MTPLEAAAAMLTLRINTPDGEWLGGDTETLFFEIKAEVDADEILLEMMNLAWFALISAASAGELLGKVSPAATQRAGGKPALEGFPTTEAGWLQQLMVELNNLEDG